MVTNYLLKLLTHKYLYIMKTQDNKTSKQNILNTFSSFSIINPRSIFGGEGSNYEFSRDTDPKGRVSS